MTRYEEEKKKMHEEKKTKLERVTTQIEKAKLDLADIHVNQIEA